MKNHSHSIVDKVQKATLILLSPCV